MIKSDLPFLNILTSLSFIEKSNTLGARFVNELARNDQKTTIQVISTVVNKNRGTVALIQTGPKNDIYGIVDRLWRKHAIG